MPKKKKAVPPPGEMTTRALRMTNAYAAWLAKAAAHDRSTMSAFLDRAAASYARTIGFEEPAPDRNG